MAEKKTEIKTLDKIKEDDPFWAMEYEDERQIQEEVQGIYAKTLVYQFEQNGRTVTGLSIKGVYEVAKSLVRHGYEVWCDLGKVESEDANQIRASCQAHYKDPNGKTLSTFGYSQASKNPFGKFDEFCFVKAMSKAQRNALKTLIPEKFAASCIEEFLRDKATVKKL